LAVDSQIVDRVLAASTASVTTNGAAKGRTFLRLRVSHIVTASKATALHKKAATEEENNNQHIISHGVLLKASLVSYILQTIMQYVP
jgi:hypothetical protein